MHYGPTSMMNTRRPKSETPFANHTKQRASNSSRSGARGSQNAQSRGSQNAQRSYERYLAQAQAQSGDVIGAENFYQHADHYFRLMLSNRESTLEHLP